MTIQPSDGDQVALSLAEPATGPAEQEPVSYRRKRPPVEVRSEDEPDRAGSPGWFDLITLIGVAGVLCFGGFGLLLADLGDYSGPAALAGGAAGTVVAVLLARPRPQERRATRSRGVTVPALVMTGVAGVVAVWNAVYSSHYVVADRDPAVYSLAGKWIAEHGNLIVTPSGGWSAKGPFFQTVSQGMYQMPNGKLQFQFAHLLPTLMAEGQNLGGDRFMFRVSALLGAIGLLAIYAVGCRLVQRPWLVLVAVTGIGVSLPEVYVSRDPFSEAATQVLLFGGVWLMMRTWATRSRGVAFVAGLAIGGTLMTHIDAAIYLLPLPLLGALGWLAASARGERKGLAGVYAAFVLGVVPTAILGTLDVQRRATPYYDALGKQMHELYAALGAGVVVAVVLVLIWPRAPGLRQQLGQRRRQLSVFATWVVAVGLVAAWALRPAGPKATGPTGLIGGLQQTMDLPVSPHRTYAEQTMRWLEWYIGPAALALGIAGLCILVVWSIRRGRAGSIVVLAMLAGITALYLWNPKVTPDQPWAIRRFATAGIPLFMIAAAITVDVTASAAGRVLRARAWVGRVLVAGTAALLAFPLAASLPIRSFELQSSYLLAVEQTCTALGPNSAVLFPLENDYDSVTLPQTLREWCGNLPVAHLTKQITSAQLEKVATDFKHEGRTLWVLSGQPSAITASAPGLRPTLLATQSDPLGTQQVPCEPDAELRDWNTKCVRGPSTLNMNSPFESYSHNREDVVLARALGGIEQGRYVDVGAGDPMYGSASMAFYALGWRGIVIESDPVKARDHRLSRPRDVLIEGEASKGDHRVADVLEEAGWADLDIHFMHADAGGAERSVIEGAGLRKWRPWILVINALEGDSAGSTRDRWEDLVVEAGYDFCLFDGISCFYVAAEHREQLATSLAYPACSRDEFTTIEERDAAEQEERATTLLEEVVRWRTQAVSRWALAVDNEAEMEHLRRQIRSAEDEYQALARQHHVMHEGVSGLHGQIEEFQSSTSWRVTRPLRVASGAVSRLRKRQ